jgi:hypothetical protein
MTLNRELAQAIYKSFKGELDFSGSVSLFFVASLIGFLGIKENDAQTRKAFFFINRSRLGTLLPLLL